MRGYYAKQRRGARCSPRPARTQVVHNYEDIPGAIPIPATLSLELGRVISEQQPNITYRFVSDYPFKGPQRRTRWTNSRPMSLTALRADPEQRLTQVSSSLFSDHVRLSRR